MNRISDNRLRDFEQSRALNMARSTHAYARGNTVKFYEWLAEAGLARHLPEGPAIWICGDCHLGNLGPVANAGSKVDVQIRNLDQSVIGNPAHHLIRLDLSLATAARGSDLPGVTTAQLSQCCTSGTRAGVWGSAGAISPMNGSTMSNPDFHWARSSAAGHR